MKTFFSDIIRRLSRLSFRTGLIMLSFCILFYLLSFAQMLLPIPAWCKGVLWATLYGCAKATQYMAILILGKSGLERLRKIFRPKAYSG